MRLVLISIALMATSAHAAGPPITEPVDTNVINTPDVNVANTPDVVVGNTELEPVPVKGVESTGEWRSALVGRASTDCSQFQTGCPFVSATVDLTAPTFGEPIPPGKALLVQTVNVTYDADGGTFPANAALQALAPAFQRYLVGEVLPTPGFTGADGMATANLNIIATNRLTGVVGFTDPNNRPTSTVQVDIYVTGRLIDHQP
jgi:hypothetical protein